MHNPLSNQHCVDYAWRQLWQRVAPQADNFLPELPFHYAQPEQAVFDGPGIIVVPTSVGWPSLLERPSNSLDWLPVRSAVPLDAEISVTSPVPVLFWGEGCEDGERSFAELRDDGKLIFNVDIIAATFFMLSRWEESVVRTRDEHNRFPGSASVAFKQGFLRRPVVDEYALILREWLKALQPGWVPQKRQFSVKLWHNIDHVRRFKNWRIAARVLAGDILKRRNSQLAWQTFIGVISHQRDPYYEGITELAQISHKYGLNNTGFHFMVEENHDSGGYDISSPLVRDCISDLRRQDFEVGLHAGYDTLNNPDELAREKAILDSVLGEKQYSGSQHFLRFKAPDTWRHWEEIGVPLVTTAGYADQDGFRCGTCHPFHPFDVVNNREIDLYELPLISMDVTLLHYRDLSPEEGEAQVMQLAQRCKEVEGTFTLLWHNSSFDGIWVPWGKMYRRLVKSLSDLS